MACKFRLFHPSADGFAMNDSAASGGVSQRNETFGAASGGESYPSWLCQKFRWNNFFH